MALPETRRAGDGVLDLMWMLWGVLVSWMQWLDYSAINKGAGLGVALLTIVLLLYRIALAHKELTDDEVEA